MRFRVLALVIIHLVSLRRAFYNNQDKTEKVSVIITTKGSDKSRVASISCVDFLVQFVRSKIEIDIDTIDIFSDGCAAQFR